MVEAMLEVLVTTLSEKGDRGGPGISTLLLMTEEQWQDLLSYSKSSTPIQLAEYALKFASPTHD